MDALGLFWIPDYLLWIIAAGIGLYIYGTWPYTILSSLGYRGPKPLPFIGNVAMIFPTHEHFGSCDKILKAEYGDMVALYEGRQPTLVLYNPDIIRHVLVKDFSNFADRRDIALRGPQMRRSLMDVKGAEWRRIRGLISPFFSSSKLRNHMGLLNTSIERMLIKIEGVVSKKDGTHAILDTKKIFGDFTMDSICLTAFGLKIDSDEDKENPFVHAAKLMMNPKSKLILLILGMIFPILNKIYDVFDIDLWPSGTLEVLNEVVNAAIAERQKSDKEYPDFIQALLNAHEEDADNESKDALGQTDDAARTKGMTNDEIMANSILFLLAGYDTTSTAIVFLMYELADNPTWQQRVVDEINDVIGDNEVTYDNLKELTTMDMCLDETLRLFPGVVRYDRKTLEEVTVEGRVIPKGCLVVIPALAIHHDPELWPDPETFDPERFTPDKKKEILNSYTYHPFGIGPRSCVGMRLAYIEIKMAVVRLLQTYKWTVSEKTKQPIELDVTIFPSAKGGIWLNIEDRVTNTTV